MRKVRLIAVVFAATAAAVAIGLWLARDQPRRIVQSALAERLDAEVTVGSLHVDGLSAARLGDVVIRMHAAPGLREIRIAEVAARGALGEMAGGRFESLRLVGVEVVVDPAAGAVWPAAGGPQMSPEVARLEIAAGRVTLLSPDGVSDIDFTADLNDLGAAPTGTVTFTGDRLQLEPLLRLAGLDVPDGVRQTSADGLVGELRLAADEPRFALSARVDRVSLAGRPVDAVARLEGTVVEEALGVLHVELAPSLSSVGEAGIEATIATSPWRVTWLRALANEIDAAAWSIPPIDLPPGWSVAGGTIDLEVDGDPASGLAVDVTAHDLDIAGSLPLRGNLTGKGEVRISGTGAPTGRIELNGRIARPPVETAPNAVLDALLPTTVAASVELAAEDRPFSGSVRLATAAAGDLDATGTAALGKPAPLVARWSWSGGDLEPLLNELAADAAALLPEGLVVVGEVAAGGRLGGSLTAPIVSGDVWVRDLAVGPVGAADGGPPGWRLSGERPAARFTWTRAKPTIELEVPDTRLIIAVDPLDPVPVVLQASATLDLERGAARLRHVVVDAGSLGTAKLDGDWQPTGSALARLAVRVEDLNGWLTLAAPVVGDALRDADASGSLTLDLEATRDTAGWSFAGPIELAGAGLSASDGSRVVEGLEAKAKIEGVAGSGGALMANVAATAGGFQLLWEAHYADFSDRHAELDIDANRSSDGDATVTVRLELPPQAALAGTIRTAAGKPSAWEGTLTVADIGGFWERYVEVPFQDTLGAAGRLRLEGGELRTQLSGTAGRLASAKGKLSLDGLSIGSVDDGSSVENLQIKLPVDLAWAEDGTVEAGAPHRGLLEFDRATAGRLPLAATATELAVLGDSVTMVGDLHVPVFGGEIVLENAGFADLARTSRYLTAAVGLHRISLADLSRTLGLPPLDGDVTGRFPRVLYSNGILTVDGTGELAVFGGTVTMRDIAGSGLLTRYPRLEFSADWQEIDLALVTRTFDFGTMSGIVEGQLVDCEIFRDVPVRFRATLRSVPHEGVPQRISLKAVNNIAIVGTGSGLGFLNSGIRRFIDSYAYRGIGIEMALSQDHFLLRGLERRGDRELFVKGRFPLRLDVVNVQPGMTVSFRTMIERLRALDVTTATPQP
ncbi:MAG: hypothetical protein AB1Z65_16625 [Candidatus Sulfomarinibacteraceae bacterium]